MQCPRCQRGNRPGAKFCDECGAPFAGAAAAAPYADLHDEIEGLRRSLNEALEQRAATSEILHVISRSPTDVQPVLDAVAERAARLCGATDALIMRVDSGMLRRVAHFGPLPTVSPARPVTRDTPTGRVVIERRAIHIHDILEEFARGEYQEARYLQEGTGMRTLVCVPLLREDTVIGVIVIRRTEVRPFTDQEIALVKTFADQAVIAIENVRLFKELETRNRELTQALERETATGDILRVISSSPTDLQPVLDAVARSAARLCASYDASIFRLDGEILRLVAHYGPILVPPGLVMPALRGLVGGRTVLDRQPIHVADLQMQTDDFPERSAIAREHGFHTLLSVPLLRQGAAIGTIALRRTEVQPFTETHIALLQTFADQAVIAIENVRLFNETKEALERQIATSEILSVIGSSPTDAQPVFDAIARSAVTVLRA